MHEKSGLLPRIEAGVTVAEAEKLVTDYVSAHVTPGRRPIVAGNTIGMDRRFISKYMPTFDERLHYRSIDVSTIKELSRQWYPAAFFATPARRYRGVDPGTRLLSAGRAHLGPGPQEARGRADRGRGARKVRCAGRRGILIR
jgi:hypothetical protein